jgi:hypothetical protein
MKTEGMYKGQDEQVKMKDQTLFQKPVARLPHLFS